MTKPAIPFNKPYITGKELHYLTEAVSSNAIAADGRFTQACAGLLEKRFRIPRVLMTPSCTAALEMAAILCDLRPGDEVIMPSFTFVSTANAVLRLGAKPFFVDIRPDTLNIDETLIEDAITSRTRAICVVHYAGVACEMDAIMAIADKHGLLVIEDAAQGVHAYYRGRALGSIGELGAYSFHDTKNYVCGEGGALCINGRELSERAEIIRDKGTNRKQFLRGQVDKYTWVDQGSSYVPSELVCAFLYAQLEELDAITDRRREIFDFYRERLESLQAAGLLTLPHIPDGCRTNYHMFYILLRDRTTRDGLMGSLRQQGIQATFHYIPLHSSPMGKRLGYAEEELPLTTELSGRLLRLPFYCDMTDEDLARVVASVSDYLARVAAPLETRAKAFV